MSKKINYNIEKMRVLSAILIVIIHSTNFINSTEHANFYNYYIYRGFLDLGVVFFFCTSGFFIACKKNYDYINKGIKKIFKYWAIAILSTFILYTIVNSMRYLFLNDSFITRTRNLLSTLTLENFLIGWVGDAIFWYFSATIVAYTAFRYFIKYKINTSTIFIISLIVWILSDYEILNLQNLTPYGGFPKAMLCMSCGYLAYEINIKINHKFTIGLLIACIASIVALKSRSLLLPLLLLSSFLILSYCKDNPGQKNFISQLGDKTLSVYIYHVFIIKMVNIFFELYQINTIKILPVYIGLIVVISFVLPPILFIIFENIYHKIINSVQI